MNNMIFGPFPFCYGDLLLIGDKIGLTNWSLNFKFFGVGVLFKFGNGCCP